MATPNYAFEKRQRDLAKKQKKEEKRKRKTTPSDDQPQEGEDTVDQMADQAVEPQSDEDEKTST